MDKVSNDFEFLKTVLCEFVSQKHITNRLNAIYSCDITGWENWLQVELGLFFNEHPEIKEWNREQRHDLDKRKHSIHNTAAIDFYIRQKYKQSAIPLKHRCASIAWQTTLKNLKKSSYQIVLQTAHCGAWAYIDKWKKIMPDDLLPTRALINTFWFTLLKKQNT